MPDATIPVRRALISVSDKTGLIPFAQALAQAGAEILSTGGTARALRDAGLTVIDVSDHTGFPEIMDGRVKTLVPQIHGGILGRRDLPEHMAQMEAHKIAPIDLVAVNLYPFEATVAAGADAETTIDNIDIGGPALIRAAAKNHDFVAVLTDPAQYAEVAEALAAGGTDIALRRRLAGAAYARTAAYDAAIAGWFANQRQESFPERFAISGRLRQTLRYGENPHQTAAFYVTGDRPGVATATQAQGKELSYNNLNDTDAAFECVAEFTEPTVVIVKHANPCGVASATSLAAAWDAALVSDPVSAFGGIVALNRTLDAETATRIAAIFTEVIIAPDATPEAQAVLAAKKNLRLLLPGAGPRCRPHRSRRPQDRHPTHTDRGGDRGPAVCLPGRQARQVQRHHLCQGRRNRGHRRWTDEPRRQRPHRRLESRRSRHPRKRRGLRRLLPLRGWARGHHRRRRHCRDPAGRIGAGP
jgi:phosphoribosylaminoimidazolecarboxamide formyltransferase/IMP cyclohydrolase